MDEIIVSASLSSRVRPETSRMRVASFRKRFNEPHYYLACHAAFPLALTPDLLYRLWANFQHDSNGRRIHIPWIAVSDLLLSNLCEEAGHELYEMDIAVRDALLNDLQAMPNFAEQRIKELAHFLFAYIRPLLDSTDPDIRDFAQTQRWTALSYMNRNVAARELAFALYMSLSQNDKPEQVRLIL